MTKDDALRRIAGMECQAVVAKEFFGAVPETCRQIWPAESSEWCAACLAKEAIEWSEDPKRGGRPVFCLTHWKMMVDGVCPRCACMEDLGR